MTELRIGVIGCGKIADVSHVPGFAALRGVRIAALCDQDEKRMADLCRRHGLDATMCTDVRSMLRCGVDAVAVCTPNDLHYPMTMAALKAGAHVLCEKPIAPTLAQATRMIDAARRAGKVLQINQTLRYLPLYATLADLVRRGRIGQLQHVRCVRLSSQSPDVGWSKGARWFVSRKHHGGIVMDIAVHMADLLKWLMGDIERIAAFVETRRAGIDVPDNVCAIFRSVTGATGVLELSWTIPAGRSHLEIFGTRGVLRVGLGDKPIELVLGSGKDQRVTYPPLKKGVKDSFASFVAAIRGQAPSPTPGELGRDALAMCDAIMRAAATKDAVKVKSFDR